uniref:CD109 antigen n=1 Tax=Lygus hesperus TaxID=30085 RepID=A0A0A9XXA7_LYGHE
MRIPKSSLFVWLTLLSPLVCGQDDDEGIGTNSRPWLNNKQQTTAWNQAADNNVIIKEPSYFVVASRMVRPGQVYKLTATILQTKYPLTVRASIQRNGVEMGAASQAMKPGISETLMIRVPPTSVRGDFKLRVEGLYNSLFGGSAFVNETILTFSQRSMTIFIQTDKPIYIQGETVNIRAIPINTELRPFDNTVDIFILDPKRFIMRRWLSRQSNLGTVSLSYQLSNQPRFGNWTIQVVAQKQVEEFVFLVEEYYQTRFEVNVTMPAFFFTTEQYLTGVVMANYTSGGPVSGNLTLKASIRPIRGERDLRSTESTYGYSEVVEKYFTFDEAVPFWYPASYYYSNSQTIPHLRFFNGVYEFRYPIAELEKHVPTLDGMEVMVTATVGERFLDEVITAYSIARVFNSSVQVNFLGGSPQVFKPAMPLSAYISVSFHDGSPLSNQRLATGQMEVTAEVISRSTGRRTIEPYPLKMSAEYNGIWEMKIDLRSQLGLDEDNKRAFEILNAVDSMRITASYRDSMGTVQASMLLLSHYSPTHNHIKISTSTTDAKVGEYIIFHVQSNFYMESFDYLVMSKGIVLHSSQEIMANNIRTFAVTLSAEMAPAATVLVYTLARHGDIVADRSMEFPRYRLFVRQK